MAQRTRLRFLHHKSQEWISLLPQFAFLMSPFFQFVCQVHSCHIEVGGNCTLAPLLIPCRNKLTVNNKHIQYIQYILWNIPSILPVLGWHISICTPCLHTQGTYRRNNLEQDAAQRHQPMVTNRMKKEKFILLKSLNTVRRNVNEQLLLLVRPNACLLSILRVLCILCIRLCQKSFVLLATLDELVKAILVQRGNDKP
ncbi:hypothetical protein T07_2533 [Trichinella nelsoni]|uniref:Uncharacterized protein n=1 Tax=Trichinella nelsoni TaxID=6336 RepID=A0A0V0S452_9BILA|nr:hypothetical protein T07_2533 [Trichinella nelsoni]